MVQMAWRESMVLIITFIDNFSQLGLKIGYYKFSYMMSTGSTSSPIGSPILLQEQTERLRSGVEGRMSLEKESKEGIRYEIGGHLLRTQAKFLIWLNFLNGDCKFSS